MPTPRTPRSQTRLPNKTQWALDDLAANMRQGRAYLDKMLDWTEGQRKEAKANMDKRRMADIGELDAINARLTSLLADMEQIVRDAREGVYRGDEPEQ